MDEIPSLPAADHTSDTNPQPITSEKSLIPPENHHPTFQSHRIIVFFLRFGIILTIVLVSVIPFKIIGTFLHELGHIISYLLLNPSMSFILNTLQGYSSWSYYELYWYEDFLTAAGGIFFSSLLLGGSIIFLHRKRLKTSSPFHFFLGCLILELILQGPIYLGLTFIEEGDPMQMRESILWFLRTQNISWDPYWYFIFIGFSLGIICTYFLIQQLAKDFVQLYFLFWKQSISYKKSLGYATFFVFLYYIFRSIIDQAFNTIVTNRTFLIFAEPPSDSYILDFYGAGFVILYLIGLGLFLNFTLVRTHNLHFHQYLHRTHVMGIVLVLLLLIFPAFGWYTTNNSTTPPGSLSNINYQFAYLHGNGSQLYMIYGFSNKTAVTGSSQRDYSGIGVTIFDPDSFSWNKSLILMQDYDLLSRITDFTVVFDEQNRLWLFYVESGDVLHDPQSNSTFYMSAWDINKLDKQSIADPIISLNQSWSSIRITDDFVSNVFYDSNRKLMWVAYTNNTYNYTTLNGIPTFNTQIYITTFNLTDFTWSNPYLWNHTLANFALSTSSVLTFHGNGSIFYDVLDGSTLYHSEYFQSFESPIGSCMENSTIPKIIQSLTTAEAFITAIRYESSRNLMLFYEDRDVWLEIYSSDWSSMLQRTRVTIDYAKQYPLAFLFNGTDYQILLSSYGSLPFTLLQTTDPSFECWNRIEPFPFL